MAENKTEAKTATFKVGKRGISEGGSYYKPGSTIVLDPKRAKALGKLVTPAPAEKADA